MTLNWWTPSSYVFQRIQLSVLISLLIRLLEVKTWILRLYSPIESPQTALWTCTVMVAVCSVRDKTVHRDTISATTWGRKSVWRTIINLIITALCSACALTVVVVTTLAMQMACEFVYLDTLIQLPTVYNLVSNYASHDHKLLITLAAYNVVIYWKIFWEYVYDNTHFSWLLLTTVCVDMYWCLYNSISASHCFGFVSCKQIVLITQGILHVDSISIWVTLQYQRVSGLYIGSEWVYNVNSAFNFFSSCCCSQSPFSSAFFGVQCTCMCVGMGVCVCKCV